MHLYELRNTRPAGTSAYLIHDANGRVRRIEAGKVQSVSLSDDNAVSLKQKDLVGSFLKIAPTSEEGEEVLQDVRPKPGKAPRMLGPDSTLPKVVRESVGAPPPRPRKSTARVEREAARAAAEEANAQAKRAGPARVVLPGRRVGERLDRESELSAAPVPMGTKKVPIAHTAPGGPKSAVVGRNDGAVVSKAVSKAAKRQAKAEDEPEGRPRMARKGY